MLAAIAALLVLQTPNVLTADEANKGWKLLFDGQTTKGWHNYKSTGIGSGWQVKDGALTIVDASKAGDIVTDEKFDWFEMTIDVKIGQGQNSGIMYHVADDGDATWHSGPEIQIYDHPIEPGVQSTGFLYELYDSKVDAAKPAGEWNTIRILVTPQKCETAVNGVKYYEYVLGSEDFKARVAQSKFAGMSNFAKLGKGSIALQGDHGNVAFRNIKIRSIK
jgi:hypothetical protein